MNRDLSRSRAILMGNSVFDDPEVPDVLAVSGCVPAMYEIITGNLCGWPEDRVARLEEEGNPSEVAEKIIDLVRDTQDVVLFYYAGHGMRTSEGQLALALNNTKRDWDKLPVTSLLYETVAKVLRRSPANTKLVILDCCHAELATRDNHLFQSISEDIVEPYPVEGLYFIGASAISKKAKSPLDQGLPYFTDGLIKVIQEGIPRKPPMLRLDHIFLELYSRLARSQQPLPVDAGVRGAYQYPFAINAAQADEGYDPGAEVHRLQLQLTASVEREEATMEQLQNARSELATAQSRGYSVNALVSSASRPVDEAAPLDLYLALPMMHLIVDGDHVASLRPREQPHSDRRIWLLAGLAFLAAITKVEVTCIFEARPDNVLEPLGVRTLFIWPRKVEEVVEELVTTDTPGRPVAVVSSAETVVDVVRRLGALPVAAKMLITWLNRGS